MKFILFIMLLVLTGCNEGWQVPPPSIPPGTGGGQSSRVTFLVDPRNGYWEFSSNPGVHYVPTGTWTITGVVTCTFYPSNSSVSLEWDDPAPGPVTGNAIVITGNGSAQTVRVWQRPSGNG